MSRGSDSSDGVAPSPPKSGEESSGTGTIFAGLARHTVIYGIGVIIGRAVSFLMLPIYTRYLTPADYGVMGLVEMTLDFVAIIGGAKLALGIFRFYHKADSDLARHQIVATSFLMIGIMYALVGTTAFLAASPLSFLIFGTPDNAILFRIAAVNLAVSSLTIVPLALARVEDRSVFFVATNLAKLVLLVALNLLFLVWMGLGVLGVFLSSLIGNVVVGTFLSLWLFRRISFSFDPASAKALFRYGFPLMGMQVATFATTFGDRFFLQGFGDESIVGLYNLAYQFAFLMVMVGFVPVDQIWGPRRFRAIREPNSDSVLSRAFILIHLLVLSTAVGIAILVGDVLRIMTTPEFFSAAAFVPVLLLAYVFQCWASVQDLGILVSERTEYLTIANLVAAAVALVGFAILVPTYLAWGAAVATLAAFGCRYLLTYTFSQRLYHIRYEWAPVLISLGWGALLVGSHQLLIPEMTLVASMGANIGFLVLFFLGLWFLPVIRGEDRRMVLRLLVSGIRSAASRVKFLL